MPHLGGAIRRGVAFLAARQSPDAMWRDFRTHAGVGSEWVTGFVCHALVSAGYRDVALPALTPLAQRQRPNGGWAYNEDVPTDCDSTAWCLLALAALPGFDSRQKIAGVAFLASHQDAARGGFATYAPTDRIDAYIKMPGNRAVRGWTQPHSCVTGVTVQALAAQDIPLETACIGQAMTYLENLRGADGLWQGYWWKDPAYATYHGAKALRLRPPSRDDALTRTGRLLAALHVQQRATGAAGAFDAAFALLTLGLGEQQTNRAHQSELATWLLGLQLPDGSWPSRPILRIPPPATRDPDRRRVWRDGHKGTGIVIADHNRVFTTSAAIWALSSILDRPDAGPR